MLDTVSFIQTPEGVELDMSPAGPVVRAVAWLIDFLIRILFYVALIILFSLISRGEDGAATGLFLISFFLIEWFYPVYFEVKRQGQTPGKKAMKLRVVHDDGTPITFASSLLRSLAMVIDMFPVVNIYVGIYIFPFGTYALGLLTTLIHPKFKRLGDMAAGTVVIHVQVEQIQDMSVIPEEDPIQLPVALTQDEQKAIVSFAERVRVQSGARNRELANMLSGLTGEEGNEGVKKLVAYANSLIGRK